MTLALKTLMSGVDSALKVSFLLKARFHTLSLGSNCTLLYGEDEINNHLRVNGGVFSLHLASNMDNQASIPWEETSSISGAFSFS